MKKHYDIIVVGGGFAGSAAAIAAARKGADVLLIEKYNCLGGAPAYSLITPFMRFWTYLDNHKSKRYLSAGIFREIVDNMRALGGMRDGDDHRFNEEILKLVLNRMAVAAGVNLLYQTIVTDVKTEGKKIISLEVSNVSGKSELSADHYIDATGDANIAYLGGFDYRLGRESDNLCQPMTLCFRLSNVDIDKYKEEKADINPLYKKFREEGKITNPREDVLVFDYMLDNTLHFNTTRVVKLDPTNAEDVTKAEIIAREQVFEIVEFLRENFEAFKRAVVSSTALQIGVRESRMIVGEKTLTKEDLLAFRKTDDSIAVCNYDIDIHNPDGSGTSHYFFPDGEYYSIPYGCLLPKDTENLIVAGRCVSASHDAQASLRIMPTCCTLGEAAGVAAAIAHEDKVNFRNVDISKLREALKQNGAVID